MFCILARLGPSAISYFASQAMPIGIWCCTLSLRQVALARLVQLVYLGIFGEFVGYCIRDRFCELHPVGVVSTFLAGVSCSYLPPGGLDHLGYLGQTGHNPDISGI